MEEEEELEITALDVVSYLIEVLDDKITTVRKESITSIMHRDYVGLFRIPGEHAKVVALRNVLKTIPNVKVKTDTFLSPSAKANIKKEHIQKVIDSVNENNNNKEKGEGRKAVPLESATIASLIKKTFQEDFTTCFLTTTYLLSKSDEDVVDDKASNKIKLDGLERVIVGYIHELALNGASARTCLILSQFLALLCNISRVSCLKMDAWNLCVCTLPSISLKNEKSMGEDTSLLTATQKLKKQLPDFTTKFEVLITNGRKLFRYVNQINASHLQSYMDQFVRVEEGGGVRRKRDSIMQIMRNHTLLPEKNVKELILMPRLDKETSRSARHLVEKQDLHIQREKNFFQKSKVPINELVRSGGKEAASIDLDDLVGEQSDHATGSAGFSYLKSKGKDILHNALSLGESSEARRSSISRTGLRLFQVATKINE